MQYSKTVRNAQNDAMTTAIGGGPVFEIYAGKMPASCDEPDSGKLIATGTLPSEWLTLSQDGIKQKAGEWLIYGVAQAGQGTKGSYFRIKQGEICHIQGVFNVDAKVKNNIIASGQLVTIESYNVKRGNA